MLMPRPNCYRLLMQVACRAFSRAWANTGNRIAARIAIIAITTSNSMSVKPFERVCFRIFPSPFRGFPRFLGMRKVTEPPQGSVTELGVCTASRPLANTRKESEVGLLSAGLAGHVRTVQAISEPGVPLSALPQAAQRATTALRSLQAGVA